MVPRPPGGGLLMEKVVRAPPWGKGFKLGPGVNESAVVVGYIHQKEGEALDGRSWL